jgi:hypothetical protein
MKFNINDDFFYNDKILAIGGKSGVGKTELLLKFSNNINYDVIYIDIDNCVTKKQFINKNSTILRLFDFDDIFDFLKNIKKESYQFNKTLIIFDQLQNIRKTEYIGEKSKIVKELIYLMYQIQKISNIKFLISFNMYTNISSMCAKVPDYFKSKLTNIIIIDSYKDVKDFNIQKLLRICKLKEILL